MTGGAGEEGGGERTAAVGAEAGAARAGGEAGRAETGGTETGGTETGGTETGRAETGVTGTVVIIEAGRTRREEGTGNRGCFEASPYIFVLTLLYEVSHTLYHFIACIVLIVSCISDQLLNLLVLNMSNFPGFPPSGKKE